MEDYPNKENISEIIKNYDKETEEIFEKIKITENNKEKFDLYEKLFERNDTKEEYILAYLLFMKTYDKDNFKNILIQKQIFISENNYKNNFNDQIENRKTARQKFLEYFEYLINLNLNSDEDKFKFIGYLFNIMRTEPNIELKTKNEITWDNEELYLNNLYLFLIDNIIKTMKRYGVIPEDGNYNHINYNSDFYTKYIKRLKQFLNNVNNNFKKKFKNLELEKIEDKLLFEDFVQFISTYYFKDSNINDYINMWRETFVPLKKEEKINNFSFFVKSNENEEIDFNYDDKFDKIEIKNKLNNEKIIIYEIDKYVFNCLCPNIISAGFDQDMIDWFKIKYLKPIFYNEDLFVAKKKDIWREIIYKILNSNTYIEIKNTLYNNQSNYFNEDIIKTIVNKIRYISYKTSFFGITNNNTLRIYEYGIYSEKIENKSITLLIYYGGHIIVNIHEIGGYINAKLHNFYCNNTDLQNSPKISDKEQHLFSNYAILREHESGESVEIKFFGKIVNDLTIREALYILNIDNYQKSLEDFKNDFNECNKKNIEELLNNDNLSKILFQLDIDKNEVKNNINNESYPISNVSKQKGPNRYPIIGHRHPFSFYDNSDWLENFLSYARDNNIKDEDLLNEFLSFKKKDKNKKLV